MWDDKRKEGEFSPPNPYQRSEESEGSRGVKMCYEQSSHVPVNLLVFLGAGVAADDRGLGLEDFVDVDSELE